MEPRLIARLKVTSAARSGFVRGTGFACFREFYSISKDGTLFRDMHDCRGILARGGRRLRELFTSTDYLGEDSSGDRSHASGLSFQSSIRVICSEQWSRVNNEKGVVYEPIMSF